MHSTTHTQVDMIIVGAGISATTLAAILLDTGLSIALVDTTPSNKEPRLDTDSRMLALTPATKNILHSAKVWETIAKQPLSQFCKMHVWDQNGSGEVHFDSAAIQQETIGYIVSQRVIEQSIKTLIKKHEPLQWHHTSQVTTLLTDKQQIHVTLHNGKQLSAKLLVAADGQSSTIRKLADIHYKTHDYHQRALTCLVKTELPHQHIARQIFLHNGPLAFLPMAESHQCGVIWSTTPEHTATLEKLDEQTFNHSLAEAFAGNAGKIIESSKRASFPLVRAQAEHYCQPRLALVGDAAHSLHPLIGQGANLGLLDVAALADIILQAIQQGKDIGNYSTLRKYERWRKTENSNMIMLAEGFKYLFENKNRAITLLRNIGMNMFDTIPICKHEIMKRAMGLKGDLPSYAKQSY